MNKNWLIRTKNNHILGPVSIGKIRTLLENNSLNLEDELCSGNGYWFSVKEDELVQKYIHDEIPQSYNPVSEAQTNLARFSNEETQDNSEHTDDVTKVGLSLDILSDEGTSDNLLNGIEELDLDIELTDAGEPPHVELPKKKPELPEDLDELSAEVPEAPETLNKNKVKKIEVKASSDLKTAKVLTSRMLYILALLFFIIALAAFYYRKNLIENFIG